MGRKKVKKLWLVTAFVTVVFGAGLNEHMLQNIETGNHQTGSFSFAVMGDNRDGNNVLKKIILSIDGDKDIKFGLNNGDLVPDGYKKEMRRYNEIVQQTKKPILSIIGNHEWLWYDSETNYKQLFGKTYFSFAYVNSYFIILDDSDEKGIDSKQTKWLITELKKSQSYVNRFVLMHVPLFDPRKGNYQKGHSLKNIKAAQALNDIFDKYHVTMLFCSHIHNYFHGKWHKTPFIITGGAGAPLKKNGFYHYIKVQVNGKDVKYKVMKIDAKAPGIVKKMLHSLRDVLNLNQ
jgi:hypothetical protein